MVKIYNTLTERKERLSPPARGPIKLFVCGPTVYDLSHIGHAKTYLAFDVIVRCLRARGFKVFYLQNITDVDDKIIERARREQRPPSAVVREFEDAYHEDMAALGIAVNRFARASEFIPAIHHQIATLIKKGFAYPTASGVYFAVKKFRRYGRLSRQNLNQLRPGWHIEPDPEKRDPLDFALWKRSAEEPNWPSPWGDGRPGWHIEDTAITEKIFGVQYHLHGGGADLKFPHHDSEIAQQESASGKRPFVKIWLHTGFLLVNGQKMSKSAGNFITVRQILKKYPPVVLRFLFASQHYRSPLNYTEGLLRQAAAAVASATAFLSKLMLVQRVKKPNGRRSASLSAVSSVRPAIGSVNTILRKTERSFWKAMEDDFNTPEALAAIFSLMNELHPILWSLSAVEAAAVKGGVERLGAILGLMIAPLAPPPVISAMVRRREEYRRQKNFSAGDALRQQIEKQGYILEDTPAGPLVLKNHGR